MQWLMSATRNYEAQKMLLRTENVYLGHPVCRWSKQSASTTTPVIVKGQEADKNGCRTKALLIPPRPE